MQQYDDNKTDSGSAIHRYFCGSCGSALFSYPDLFPGAAFVKVRSRPRGRNRRVGTARADGVREQIGILDRAAEIKPKAEICTFALVPQPLFRSN